MGATEQHTPTPWVNNGNDFIEDSQGEIIAQTFNKFEQDFENKQANSRRIVACVNAFEGVDTDTIEGASNGKFPKFNNVLNLIVINQRLVNEVAEKTTTIIELKEEIERLKGDK